MRFASVLGTHDDPDEALADVVDQLQQALPGVHLVVAFTSHGPEGAWLQALTAAFPGARIVGCQAAGVLASGLELEGTPGLAVLGGYLPGVDIDAFHLDRALFHGDDELVHALTESVGEGPVAGMMVLADPFTFDLASLVPAATAALPGVPLFGGQASGASHPTPHALFLDARRHQGGALCVVFRGDLRIETRVAQGCRPVGAPMFVTRCQANRLLELDGRAAVDVVRDLYDSLDVADQAAFRVGQFLGIQMRDQTEYHAGDFLVRNVLGVPEGGRGIAIGAPLKPFDVVQFHVRDGRTSRDDLRAVLADAADPPPAGALLFTCVGRGRSLYGEPHHDSRTFLEGVGPVALAGFFANGELGPVQGVPYIHGYTSVFALFRSLGDEG